VLKLQWQIVFKKNSAKAVEVDIWTNLIDFLSSLGELGPAGFNPGSPGPLGSPGPV